MSSSSELSSSAQRKSKQVPNAGVRTKKRTATANNVRTTRPARGRKALQPDITDQVLGREIECLLPEEDDRFAPSSKSTLVWKTMEADGAPDFDLGYYFSLHPLRSRNERSRTVCTHKEQITWALEEIGIRIESGAIEQYYDWKWDESTFIVKLNAEQASRMPRSDFPLILTDDIRSKKKFGHALPHLVVERHSWTKRHEVTTLGCYLNDLHKAGVHKCLQTLLDYHERQDEHTLVKRLPDDGPPLEADVLIKWDHKGIEQVVNNRRITLNCSPNPDYPRKKYFIVAHVHHCMVCGGESTACEEGGSKCRWFHFQKA